MSEWEEAKKAAMRWAHGPVMVLIEASEAEITRLKEELDGCKEKRLAECPMCKERFFVDEDGSIDAFIGA